MRFNSEEDAYNYWQAAYSLSGNVAPLENRGQLFNEWVDDQGISWLDEELQQFIKEFEEEYYNEKIRSV